MKGLEACINLASLPPRQAFAFPGVRDSRPKGSCGPSEAELSCIEQRGQDAGVCGRKRPLSA